MVKTSVFFKICYIAAMLASLCSVIAHGAVMLLTLPAHEVPWSADQKLAPLNAGTITTGRLATIWVYLKQVVGATVSDTLSPGYHSYTGCLRQHLWHEVSY